MNPDDEGFVHPGKGGMSVAPNVESLPAHRQPRRLRIVDPQRFPDAQGPDLLYCWHTGAGEFQAGAISDRLSLRLDPEDPMRHGLVEPAAKMILADYEGALMATRDHWCKWEELDDAGHSK